MRLLFQVNPTHLRHDKKYRLYSPTSLTNAYLAVLNDGLSQRRAAVQFNIPRQTLRDRLTGKIDPECVTTGRTPTFSLEEESRIVEHVKSMASFGYGYTRQEVTDLATDFAHSINKKATNEVLTLRWFDGFMGRWPELRVLKPRGLEIARAKCCSVDAVQAYFLNLEEVLIKYELLDKPHLVFNVDEKGITLNHKPPCVVAGISCETSAVTSGRSSTTTILGCGSASGLAIPPYFVFEGQRLMPELLNGANPGADGTVSDSGWSNTKIFKKYLTEHFLKFVPGRQNEKLLLLMDGHKSHVAVDIIEWAQAHNIILHILPAHTSHVLQPLDVGCFGPLQRIYDNECHKTIRQNSSVITRYNICELASKAYQKALSTENLQSSFKRAGIFPLNKNCINPDLLKPSEAFTANTETGDSQPENIATQNDNDAILNIEINQNDGTQMENDEVMDVETNQIDDTQIDTDDMINEPVNGNNDIVVSEDGQDIPAPYFFSSKIDHLVKVKSEKEKGKKQRNTLGRVVSGKSITEIDVAEKVKAHVEKQGKCQPKTKKVTPPNTSNKKGKQTSKTKSKSKPGCSFIYIEDSMDFEDTDTDDEEITESERCCVCKQFTPKEIRGGAGLELTKWVQCENLGCRHWTHLKYCTQLRAVRRDTKFFCIHCKTFE